jgi:hypothetical protein
MRVLHAAHHTFHSSCFGVVVWFACNAQVLVEEGKIWVLLAYNSVVSLIPLQAI